MPFVLDFARDAAAAGFSPSVLFHMAMFVPAQTRSMCRAVACERRERDEMVPPFVGSRAAKAASARGRR